jgi:hypothetical protein
MCSEEETVFSWDIPVGPGRIHLHCFGIVVPALSASSQRRGRFKLPRCVPHDGHEIIAWRQQQQYPLYPLMPFTVDKPASLRLPGSCRFPTQGLPIPQADGHVSMTRTASNYGSEERAAVGLSRAVFRRSTGPFVPRHAHSSDTLLETARLDRLIVWVAAAKCDQVRALLRLM